MEAQSSVADDTCGAMFKSGAMETGLGDFLVVLVAFKQFQMAAGGAKHHRLARFVEPKPF